MARFTWDAMYEQLTPIYGGLPLWQSTQDMLDAFWLSRGYADAPQGDALYAFYVAQGAVGVTLGDLENDYWDRIGPNVLVGLGATLVLDARNSKVGEQWALNMGSGGQVLRAKYGSVARAEIRQGVGLVTPDGSSGDTIEVPDSAAVSITGDFELVYRVEPDDWTPSASNRYPVGKRKTTGNQRSWLAEQVTDGRIIFRWSEDGITELVKVSTASVPFADAVCGYVKITLDVDNGASGNTLTFYTAPDSGTEPLTWTMLGSPVVTAGVTSIFDSNAKITFGRWEDGGALFGGTTKRVILRNGIGGSTVLDIDFTKQADLTTSFVCDTGQTVTVTAVNAVDTNDPLFLPWTGENYVYLPGLANCFVSTPAVAYNLTGDVEFVVQTKGIDWSGPRATIVGSWSGGFLIDRTTSGRVHIGSSLNANNHYSQPSHGLTGVVDQWFKFQYIKSTGLHLSFKSTDGVSWTDITSTTSLDSAGQNFPNFTMPIAVGGNSATGWIAGNVPFAEMRNGIDGPAVWRYDASDNTADNQNSWTSSTGEVWTVNRATSGRKTVVVTRPCWLFGTDDYMEVADNALLNFANTDNFTVMAVSRGFADRPSNRPLVGKKSDTSAAAVGYQLMASVTDYMQVSDGTNQNYDFGAAYDPGNLQVQIGVKRGVTDIEFYKNSTSGGATAHSLTATLTNTFPLRVGAVSGVASFFFGGEVFAVAVFNRVLTPAEIAQIVAAFGAA